MMKRKRSGSDNHSEWSEEELEIAQLLNVLPHSRWYLMSHIPFNWGCTKKRTSAPEATTTTQSPSCSSQPRHGCAAAAAVGPSSNARVVKEQAASPISPLLFRATESDEKIKHSLKTKTSVKRKKEDYLQTIQNLTKMQAELNQEIEKVKRHCEQLRAFNLKLKEREQQLCNGSKKPNTEIPKQNQMPLNKVNGSVNTCKPTSETQNSKEKESMVNNNMNFGKSGCESGYFHFGYPTTSFPVTSSKGPQLLPDLNLSIDELVHLDVSQPLDETAAKKELSRAARQRRLQIYKQKNSSNNNSPNVGNNNAKFPGHSYGEN